MLLAAYEQDLGDHRRLGQILLERGLVSPGDVEVALLEQRIESPAADAGQDVDVPAGPDAGLDDGLDTARDARDADAEPGPPADPADDVVPVQPEAEAPQPHTLPSGALQFPRPQSSGLRRFQAVMLLLLLAGAVALVATATSRPAYGVTLYTLFVVPYLLVKLTLSMRYRASKAPVPDLDLSVVVPFVNEDPATFERCLLAVLDQTQPVEHIYVVDDGSRNRDCLNVALRLAASHPQMSVHRFEDNLGKRAAQCWAFEQTTTALVATVDSDTVLHPEALREALRPFDDAGVNGVCGYARGTNKNQNLLTRLIDLRYTNSFLYERAAYSQLGSVLCSTGVLSVWRTELVHKHLEDYLGQTFMGTEVHYGDDRRMTAYALRTGKVVLQESAIALTAVPHTMKHFVRQQVRWNKSFFRESWLLLREMRPSRVAWWLGFLELAYWMVLTTLLLYTILIRPLLHLQVPSWHYLAFIAVMAYARSIRMIGDGGRLFPTAFLLAPVYGFLNLIVLVPLRLYSLLRLRDGSWGTRPRPRISHRRSRRDDELHVVVPAVAPATSSGGNHEDGADHGTDRVTDPATDRASDDAAAYVATVQALVAELAEQPDAGPAPDDEVDHAPVAEGAQETVGDASVAEEPDESELVAVGPGQPATWEPAFGLACADVLPRKRR